MVLSVMKDGGKTEYPGILKDYTTQFIEIMDTSYSLSGSEDARKADIVVPRSIGIVRHAG